MHSHQPLSGHYPMEDRVMKAAARLLGEELLPMLGIHKAIRRIAPTEQVYLELRDFSEDFNFELTDGSWLHLEFESDSITKDDLIRFRAYEAVISYHYHVPVTTCVICSAHTNPLMTTLTQGLNTYCIQTIRLKDQDAGQLIHELEQRQYRGGRLPRRQLLQLLLTPLMDGAMTQLERFDRSIHLLQQEQNHLAKEELMQMQAVLYLLAIKFLPDQELDHVKEELRMTVVGRMLWQEGLEEGIEKGIEKGTDKVNQLIQCLFQQNRADEIQKAVEDREYQQKLFQEFNL